NRQRPLLCFGGALVHLPGNEELPVEAHPVCFRTCAGDAATDDDPQELFERHWEGSRLGQLAAGDFHHLFHLLHLANSGSWLMALIKSSSGTWVYRSFTWSLEWPANSFATA